MTQLHVLIGSNNRGKLRELQQLLRDLPGLRLLTLADFPELPEVEETGETMRQNAALKAQQLARASGLWTLADDSGLEVDKLNGAPGVRSRRYASSTANDADNNRKLLGALHEVPWEARQARFRCVIAYCGKHEASEPIFFEGVCEGRIALRAKGQHGFGYDPLFIPEGYAQTFAELGSDIKQRISHRARALAQLRAHLRQQLAELAASSS